MSFPLSDPPPESTKVPPADDISFDRAIPVTEESAPQRVCSVCRKDIADVYYVADSCVYCSDCADAAAKATPPKPNALELGRAAAWGAGAALLGTAIYFSILAISGYEFGLIAVAVGWLVGKAVRRGTNAKGGRAAQVLAVLLTYSSIVGSYVPLAIKEIIEKQDSAKPKDEKALAEAKKEEEKYQKMTVGEKLQTVGLYLVIMFVIMLAAPFLSFNPIGYVIIAIGLWEAWKINRAPQVQLAGPFSTAGNNVDAG